MPTPIHPTALVDPGAELADGVTVGPFAVIGPDVVLGAETRVDARATILGRTTVGKGCRVGVGAVLGTVPQDRKYAGEDTQLRVGDDTIIREYTTLNVGTETGGGVTLVGKNCFLMSYVHVAHDCALGDGVVIANAVQLAGHVRIDDYAQVGGTTPVHQFVHIGTHAFVGGGSRAPQDVPPYVMAAGNPLRLCGINVEGLRRAGFSSEVRLALKRAYRVLFNSSLPRAEAVERVRAGNGHVSEVMTLVDFVAGSRRGVLV
jgi:UDP-N-acetylglucosamine acyltransferase